MLGRQSQRDARHYDENEDRIEREIIEGYDNLTVTALESDPTTCLVEFEFTVVHGLNRIFLTAHISV